MKLIRILWLAAWFVAATTAAAHAGAVAGAVGAIVSAIGSLGALGQLAIGLAVKVGVSLLQRAMGKKEQQPGIKGQIQVGGDNPLSFIVGTYATAGQLEYVNTSKTEKKTPNAYLTQVISLSDLPISAILTSVWINGEKCTIDPADNSYVEGHPVTQYWNSGGGNHLWVKRYLGTQTVADSFLRSRFGSDAVRPWNADMVGRGLAYAIVTAQRNGELFTGPPSCRFEVQGIPLYDPRKDSTVGGSGSQRWSDPSTWAFSDNPVVVIYNILRGIYYQGRWVYGLQDLPASRLPLSNWFAAMNECDRLVGGQRQFRCGAEISVDQQPIDVIEELLKACNGKMAEIGGTYKIRVGPPVLPVYALTDDAISITDSRSFEPFPGLENTHNGIHASYPEPSAAWEMKDAPPRYRSDLESQDGGRRLVADVAFAFVPFPTQVQLLSKALIETERRFRTHRMTLPPEASELEPLDAITWTSPREGYVNKLFDIESMDDLENVNQIVAVREADPSDYDWNPDTDELPSSVGFLGPIRPEPMPIVDWFAEGVIQEVGSKKRSCIRLYWDGEQAGLARVQWEVRRADNLVDVHDGSTDSPERGSVLISQNIFSNSQYQVRGRYILYPPQPTLWSDWLPVTTPDQPNTDVYMDIDLDDIAKGLTDDLEWIGDGTRELIQEAQRNALLTVDQDAGNFEDIQQIRKEMVSVIGAAEARWTLDITTAVGPGSAISQRLETLEVKVDEDIATAVDLLQTKINTVDGRVTATAEALTALDVTVGRFSASGYFRVTTEATPTGALSRIGLSVSATDSGATSQAAIFIDAVAGGKSRVVVMADQFVVSNGAQVVAPFVFSGNTAYLENARIGTVIFNQLSSANGKLIIRGSGSLADIRVFT